MNEIAVPQYHVHDFPLHGAAPCDNPFDVEASATFVHESGEVLADVPAFHSAPGIWTVRFCPWRLGVWRGRTASADADLDAVELPPVRCTPNPNPLLHGRLRVDPRRSRRFAFEDGTCFVPLGFECDWLFSLHQSRPDGFREMIDRIVERGFNYVVTNVYAHTGFSDASGEHVFGPPRLFVFAGTNEQPDHSRLNPAFFDDFDAMLACLHAKGIVAHLMIHVQNKHVNWPARRSADDERYWRYVVARYQAWPNVVWDVGKECWHFRKEFDSHDYTIERVGRIRSADAYHHLVTVHDGLGQSEGRNCPADEVCDFVADQVHLADAAAYNREAVRRFRTQAKPYLNVEYGYEQGAEPIPTYTSRHTTADWEKVLAWTWAIYLGGACACYYYSNTAWDLIKYDPEPPGWRRYRYLADVLAELDVSAMVPDNEYVARGLCLAEAGRQYLAFLPGGGDLQIDLSAVDAGRPMTCTWLDVRTGERAAAAVEGGRFTTRIANPLPDAAGCCAIVLKA